MNNEKQRLKMPETPDVYEDCRTPKHELADNSIERLGLVLFGLESLSSRISSEPFGDFCEPEVSCRSMEEYLRTAPERIDCFIGAAESLIEQIEEKLF